jgi:F-box-like
MIIILCSDKLRILPISGIVEEIPEEILEKVFSFCSGEDLLRLTETCKTFKQIIVNNTSLMGLFRMVLRHENQVNFKEFKKCFESRRFTAFTIESEYTFRPQPGGTEIVQVLTLNTNESIEELVLKNFGLEESELEKLLTIFPNVQCLSFFNIHAPSISRIPIQYTSLKRLNFDDSDPEILFKFSHCKNLISLRIHIRHAYPLLALFFKGSSFWKLLKSKLERLDIPMLCGISHCEDFQEFLLSQTKLREVSLYCPDIYTFRNIVEQLPWVKRFEVRSEHDTFNIGWIPHFHLEKCVVLNYDIDRKVDLIFQTEAPADMDAFESDFIEFVSKESLIKGVKISDFIVSLALGHDSWLNEEVELSEKFLTELINKLPKLTRIALFSATSLDEVIRIIANTGRKFKKIYVMTEPDNLITFDNLIMLEHNAAQWYHGGFPSEED